MLFLLLASVSTMAQYGQGYGNGKIVSCNSNDMRRNFCTIGPNSGVRLYRQHSDAACIQGRTFGVRGRQMWVDRGCRAEFQVIPDRHGRDNGWSRGHDNDHGYGDRDDHDGWTRPPVSSTTLYCASDNMRRNYCTVGSYRNIRLVRKRSDAACDMNRTYGFDRNGIWVDRGCRAEFEVFR